MNNAKLRVIRDKILSWNWPPIIKKLLTHWLSISFIKYFIVGISSFLIQVGLLFLFTDIVNLDKVTANILAAFAAISFNFYTSNKWSFKNNNKNHSQKIFKFTAITIFNYCFDTLLAFPLMAVTLGINQYLTKVIITGLMVIWNFFIYKLWVFKT